MEQLTHIVHDVVVHLGYLGLFLVMMLGNMGAPAGTEIVMPTAGGLAAQGHFPGVPGVATWLLVGLVGTAAEVVGGGILYAVGYYGGEPFLERYGKYIGFKQKELGRVHGFYERFGNQTVFWCRFIPFIRGVSAFPAGVARMQKRYFVTYTALGSAIFCFGLAYLGNLAGKNVDSLDAALHKFSTALIVGIAVVIVAFVVYKIVTRGRKRSAAERDVA